MTDGHVACLRYAHECDCTLPDVRAQIPKALATHIFLPKWRAYTRLRAIALFWHDFAGRRAYGPDGAGRKRDLDAFLADGFGA